MCEDGHCPLLLIGWLFRAKSSSAFMMSEEVERAECGDEGCNSLQQEESRPQPRNHLLGRLEAGLAEMRGKLGLVEAGLESTGEDG